jgi:hypothetical protein
MRGFGAFVVTLWLALVLACLAGAVFVVRSCSSDDDFSTAASSDDSGSNQGVPLPGEELAKRQASLEEIHVATIRSLGPGWQQIPTKAVFMGLEFPRGKMSEVRPTRLNMALMVKPSLRVEAPSFYGRTRYCWPKLWLISGHKRVQVMRSLKTPDDELEGMTHLSFSTIAGSTLPKPLDVQITVSDLAERPGQVVRVARFQKSKGGVLTWGLIPSGKEYKRRLYVRFANPMVPPFQGK